MLLDSDSRELFASARLLADVLGELRSHSSSRRRRGVLLRAGKSNPACRENEQPYWAANPLHGSQKSAPWVSKIRSTGLKILLHGSQKSPASGNPRAVYDPGSLLDAFTLSLIGFLLCLSSLFVPMNLCAAYYSIFCGSRVASEGLRRKLFFPPRQFPRQISRGFFDIIRDILRGVDRCARS